jgi:hypothetical protein
VSSCIFVFLLNRLPLYCFLTCSFSFAFADSFPEYYREAEDAVREIRAAAQKPMVPREVWTVEELCAAIHARLKPARDLLSK